MDHWCYRFIRRRTGKRKPVLKLVLSISSTGWTKLEFSGVLAQVPSEETTRKRATLVRLNLQSRAVRSFVKEKVLFSALF